VNALVHSSERPVIAEHPKQRSSSHETGDRDDAQRVLKHKNKSRGDKKCNSVTPISIITDCKRW
jgi:hypothetical protein